MPAPSSAVGKVSTHTGAQPRAAGKSTRQKLPCSTQLCTATFPNQSDGVLGIKLEDLKLFTPQRWPSPSHHHVLPHGVGHFPPNPQQPPGDPHTPLLHCGTKNSWELSRSLPPSSCRHCYVELLLGNTQRDWRRIKIGAFNGNTRELFRRCHNHTEPSAEPSAAVNSTAG